MQVNQLPDTNVQPVSESQGRERASDSFWINFVHTGCGERRLSALSCSLLPLGRRRIRAPSKLFAATFTEVCQSAKAALGRSIAAHNHQRPRAAHGGLPPAMIYCTQTETDRHGQRLA